jgi:hypothetical protein
MGILGKKYHKKCPQKLQTNSKINIMALSEKVKYMKSL